MSTVRRIERAARMTTGGLLAMAAISGCWQADAMMPTAGSGRAPSATNVAGSLTPSAAGIAAARSGTARSASGSDQGSGPDRTGSGLVRVPVYWIGQSRTTFTLHRELRSVPDVGGPVASAVAAMTRLTPRDPDLFTPWRPATRVAVTRDGTTLMVDLSVDALRNTQVGSELAERAVQQLVYTAIAASRQAGRPAQTVTVTVDGAPHDAWGTVRLGEPMTR